MLYQTELRRLLCRGRRNRTSANGPKMQKRICCKLPSLDASKNTSCCHYTIPQKLWPFSTSAPFPLNLRRYELNDHLFAYRIRTCASRFHASMLPLHQTDFTKYRPYSLLALHGFLFRYCPTPTTHIVQMFSWSGISESNRHYFSLEGRCHTIRRIPHFTFFGIVRTVLERAR